MQVLISLHKVIKGIGYQTGGMTQEIPDGEIACVN